MSKRLYLPRLFNSRTFASRMIAGDRDTVVTPRSCQIDRITFSEAVIVDGFSMSNKVVFDRFKKNMNLVEVSNIRAGQ